MTAAEAASFLRFVHAPAIAAGMSGRVVITQKNTPGEKANYISKAYRLDQLDDAAEACARISDNSLNAYCRVHLVDRAIARHERGKYTDTRFVTHFAADVDIAGPGHTSTLLPPDLETAVRLIDATLAPSVVIASGGGLYPIWRLSEPFTVETDDDRNRVRDIGRRFDGALASHGFHVDATVLDLTRIIRPPGVVNHKPGRDPCPVTVLRGYLDGAGNYRLDQLETLLPELPERSSESDRLSLRRPSTDSTDSAPWNVLDELYSVDDILAADPHDRWERVDDQADGRGHQVPAWRRVGSSADYSIKAGSGGALIVWSSTLAARLGIDNGGGISRWQLLCAFDNIDPSAGARWSA